MDSIERSMATLASAGVTPALQAKARSLFADLTSLESAVVAYSGGVDSAFLAYAASRVLGERLVAVTVASPFDPPAMQRAAAYFAAQHGIVHRVVAHDPLQDPGTRTNPPDRCYHCKTAILELLWVYAREHGFAVVIEGQNADDQADYRPGRRAVQETGTLSPLVRSDLAKAEIRQLARALSLSIWDQPSSPCLATRIPYGIELTQARLAQVGAAEDFLHAQGFRIVRVRHHGDVARIEVLPEQIPALLAVREDVAQQLRQIGFRHVALDLQGYRMGSMNEGVIS